MLHVLDVEVIKDFILRLAFDDGTVKIVDVKPLLKGPVFKPLKDPVFFAKVTIDPIAQTVVWPNGADFAPEALYDLKSMDSVA
ncbi:MAG: DUF2442 domain-containing protein [Spirochaetales bacterium]|nr:DUF2442 domain-containing protein [Spirochaetales bacterium]